MYVKFRSRWRIYVQARADGVCQSPRHRVRPARRAQALEHTWQPPAAPLQGAMRSRRHNAQQRWWQHPRHCTIERLVIANVTQHRPHPGDGRRRRHKPASTAARRATRRAKARAQSRSFLGGSSIRSGMSGWQSTGTDFYLQWTGIGGARGIAIRETGDRLGFHQGDWVWVSRLDTKWPSRLLFQLALTSTQKCLRFSSN